MLSGVGSTALPRWSGKAWTCLLPARKCCEVSASVFSLFVRRNPSSQPWLRVLDLPGELPGAGTLSKGDALCVQTRVLSLTLIGQVSVARGQGRLSGIRVQNLYLEPRFFSGPMKSPVDLSSSYGLKDRSSFDRCDVFDLCSDLSLACGRERSGCVWTN